MRCISPFHSPGKGPAQRPSEEGGAAPRPHPGIASADPKNSGQQAGTCRRTGAGAQAGLCPGQRGERIGRALYRRTDRRAGRPDRGGAEHFRVRFPHGHGEGRDPGRRTDRCLPRDLMRSHPARLSRRMSGSTSAWLWLVPFFGGQALARRHRGDRCRFHGAWKDDGALPTETGRRLPTHRRPALRRSCSRATSG